MNYGSVSSQGGPEDDGVCPGEGGRRSSGTGAVGCMQWEQRGGSSLGMGAVEP